MFCNNTLYLYFKIVKRFVSTQNFTKCFCKKIAFEFAMKRNSLYLDHFSKKWTFGSEFIIILKIKAENSLQSEH